MEKRAFGKTGMQVGVLGFGGSEIGFERISVNAAKEILSSALDLGVNVIDTAECYVDSEELIGNAIGHRRADYYLFTKCGHGPDMAAAWGFDQITKSIDRSLRRLKTDYVDLLQLHSCSEEILRKGEAIEAVQRAKKAGKARFIGYSGDGDAALYALQTGVFDALQTSISIADQQALDLTLPYAIEHGIGVIAKRPIANAVWRSKTRPENNYVRPYWDRLKTLQYDFLNNGHKHDPAEIALRFILSVPGVSVAIVGTTKPKRLPENTEIADKGALAPEEFDKIRRRWKEVALPAWEGQV